LQKQHTLDITSWWIFQGNLQTRKFKTEDQGRKSREGWQASVLETVKQIAKKTSAGTKGKGIT